jgi:tight adherence protein B
LLRKRRQLRLKIRAMSSEARASAMIIGSLPYLMFLLLYFVNSEYMMVMLTTMRGKFMLGVGLGWHALGIYVMKQMIAFEI